jgi:hypothetical protein
MFIETVLQVPSKLRQERHVYASKRGGYDLPGVPFQAAPDAALA